MLWYNKFVLITVFLAVLWLVGFWMGMECHRFGEDCYVPIVRDALNS